MVKQHTARTMFTCAWHPCALATASGAAQTLPYAYMLDKPRLTLYTGPPTYPKAERPEEDDELVVMYLTDSKLTSDN